MTSDAPEFTAIPTQLDTVATATERLLTTVADLRDADLVEPSLLPGWTRGHVLSHLSRNADSLVNLLLWARTGIETPQYASAYLRDADIEAGAPRPLREQLDDLRAASDRWLDLARVLPEDRWATSVRNRQGTEIPATRIVWMRLLEVEIHHVDLAVAYSPPTGPPRSPPACSPRHSPTAPAPPPPTRPVSPSPRPIPATPPPSAPPPSPKSPVPQRLSPPG